LRSGIEKATRCPSDYPPQLLSYARWDRGRGRHHHKGLSGGEEVNVLTWTKRETMPQIGQFVMIDGRRGEIQHVTKNLSGSATIVQIKYSTGIESTTLTEFLASLEVKQ